jgi:hypothetical protein
MLAHALQSNRWLRLVRSGLATAKTEHMIAGGRALEVTHVKITEAGQRGLTAGCR